MNLHNKMKLLKATSYIEYKALVNNKHIIWSSLLTPILYFIFFGLSLSSTFNNIYFRGKEVDYISFIFIGILGIILNSQLNQSVYRINIDKKWGLLAYKYKKGTTSAIYFLGKFIFPMLMVVVQSTILYIIFYIFSVKISLLVFVKLLLIVVLGLVFWFSVGIIISLGTLSYKTRDFILGTALLPIIFSAPTFYSFENVPILYYMSQINPLTYQITSMRVMLFENGFDYNFIITSLLAIIALAAAMFVINHTELLGDER